MTIYTISSSWTLISTVSILVMFTTGANAQAFGPAISTAEFIAYRNPGTEMINLSPDLVNGRWTIDAATSLVPDDARKASFQHQFLGVRFRVGEAKPLPYSFEVQAKLELNAIQPLRYQSAHLGGIFKYDFQYKNCKQFQVRAGIQLGMNNWHLKDAPDLRPWDQGDPILATFNGSSLHPYLNAGLGFRGAISMDRTADCDRPGKAKWLMFSAGLALRNLVGCSGEDCFVFSSPLPAGEFVPGREVSFSNLSRIDATINYQDNNIDKWYMVSLRYYHHGARPYGNEGLSLRIRKGLLNNKLKAHTSVGKQLGLAAWMFRIGVEYQTKKNLVCGFSLFALRYPPETFVKAEGLLLSQFGIP